MTTQLTYIEIETKQVILPVTEYLRRYNYDKNNISVGPILK